MTDSDRKAIDILTQDNYKFNIDLIDPLTTGLGHAVDVHEDGVLVNLNGTFSWTAKTEKRAVEIAEMIKDTVKEDVGIYSHTMVGIEKTAKILNGDLNRIPCFIAARFSKEKYEINTDVTFRKLDHSFDEFVWKTYNFTKDYEDGIYYARDRIESGTVYGAFSGDTCVGFIGTHHEGTMGMLEILPQYRRRGYGEALEKYLANTFIDQNRYPFCHILENNAASLKLQASLGMYISEEKAIWF